MGESQEGPIASLFSGSLFPGAILAIGLRVPLRHPAYSASPRSGAMPAQVRPGNVGVGDVSISILVDTAHGAGQWNHGQGILPQNIRT